MVSITKYIAGPLCICWLVLQKFSDKGCREKGKTLRFEILDEKLETIIIVGLGKSKDLNKSDIENFY